MSRVRAHEPADPMTDPLVSGAQEAGGPAECWECAGKGSIDGGRSTSLKHRGAGGARGMAAREGITSRRGSMKVQSAGKVELHARLAQGTAGPTLAHYCQYLHPKARRRAILQDPPQSNPRRQRRVPCCQMLATFAAQPRVFTQLLRAPAASQLHDERCTALCLRNTDALHPELAGGVDLRGA